MIVTPAPAIYNLRHIAIIGSRGFPSTYGGYETAVRYIARDWISRGIIVTVYCRERLGYRKSWNTEGVACRQTPGIPISTLSTLTFGATACAHVALRSRPDAALVLNIANGFWLPTLKLAGIPTVVNTDGIEWERAKWSQTGRRVFYKGAQATAKYADVVVCDSRAIGDIWQQEFGVDSVFVPYGAPIPDNVREDRVRELGLVPGTYALAVARLIPENNVELFLNALESMQSEVPAVVVGSAAYKSPLEARLRRLHHQGRVHWLGHVDDQHLLVQLWANAGVYVHGHSVGGTNPALLQALGAGAPTVAFDTPFNQEVLCPGGEAQLYPHDPNALAGIVQQTLASEDRRSSMAARGRAIVADRYTWRGVSQGYLEALALARVRSGGAPPSEE